MNWTDLGSGVRVRRSARYQMNSIVLLDPEHTVLVDPGILPSELDDIAQAVSATRADAISVIFTHPHWDHVLGKPWWPAAETLAHDGFATQLRNDLAHVREEAGKVAEQAGQRWARPFEAFTPTHAVSGLHFRRLGAWRLVFRDAPGHCATQLNVHLPERGILIAADMLSDIEIPGLDSPPEVYRRSLEALLPIVEGGAIETLIPGHGAIARGVDAVQARFRADLDYLDAIERGAREARAAGLDAAATAAKLANMSYAGKGGTEYPMEPIHKANVERAWRAAASATKR